LPDNSEFDFFNDRFAGYSKKKAVVLGGMLRSRRLFTMQKANRRFAVGSLKPLGANADLKDRG
jgi:hypothetical protein